MIDYKAIIDNLTENDIIRILKHLDIPYEDKGTHLLMPTYCHNHKSEDASHKLYYYKNYKVFMCYTQCGSQSIFKFLKNFYEAQEIDYNWYEDVYCLITGGRTNEFEGLEAPKYDSLRNKYEVGNTFVPLPAYNEGVLDCFVKKYPIEWLNDGITSAAMDKFDIRYSISQNKIVIPHRDKDGNLVGIRGRALNKWEVDNLGKYMPIQIENVWYKHPLSMNLYGLYENKQNITQSGIAFLVESEKSVMQAESFDRPNCCVAVCGSNLNKFALSLLLKECHPREIVVCFDKEELSGEHRYFDKLMTICRKYSNYATFSFIYDRENLLNLKDSPTDKGQEVFERLLEKRVRVI